MEEVPEGMLQSVVFQLAHCKTILSHLTTRLYATMIIFILSAGGTEPHLATKVVDIVLPGYYQLCGRFSWRLIFPFVCVCIHEDMCKYATKEILEKF